MFDCTDGVYESLHCAISQLVGRVDASTPCSTAHCLHAAQVAEAVNKRNGHSSEHVNTEIDEREVTLGSGE